MNNEYNDILLTRLSYMILSGEEEDIYNEETLSSEINNNCKTVLSTEGENELKFIKFKDCSKLNNKCLLLLEEFIDESDIIELPCRHIFSEKVLKWLKEESNECPICRYKLHSKIINRENREYYGLNYLNLNLNLNLNSIPSRSNIYELVRYQTQNEIEQACLSSFNI